MFWKYLNFSQLIPRDNDDSFQLFLQYADKVHVTLQQFWIVRECEWLERPQIFKSNRKFFFICFLIIVCFCKYGEVDAERLQRLLNENLYAGDVSSFQRKFTISAHFFKAHIPVLLPFICDYAYVLYLISQDIHRKRKDSAWICVGAWWRWWMYPLLWRVEKRLTDTVKCLSLPFVNSGTKIKLITFYKLFYDDL